MVVPTMFEIFTTLPIISDHPGVPRGSCAGAGSLCHQLYVALPAAVGFVPQVFPTSHIHQVRWVPRILCTLISYKCFS